MGSNFHTPWTTDTTYVPGDMNAPLVELDKGMGYLKNVIVHCDGAVHYHPDSGDLSWDSSLRVIFNAADGKACTNVVAAGTVRLVDNEFAYIDLSETNGATVTVQKVAVNAGGASNFIAYNRVVLGYRNAVSNDFYPVALRAPWPTTSGS